MLELTAAILWARQLLPSIPQKLHGTKNVKSRCQSVHNGTDAYIHFDYSLVSAVLLAHEEVSAASSYAFSLGFGMHNPRRLPVALLLRFNVPLLMIAAFVIFVLGYLALFVSLLTFLAITKGLYEGAKRVQAYALRSALENDPISLMPKFRLLERNDLSFRL
jgi:hypothetical protein